MTQKNKSTKTEYPIRVIGRHLEVTEAMKSYALDKLSKIDKFGGRVIEATVIMDIQKLMHTVEYIIDVNNTKINVSGHSNNMYASIDQAIDRLEGKLSRYLRRLHEHHTKAVSEVDMTVNVVEGPTELLDDINDEIEEENLRKVEEHFISHKIVSKEKMSLKNLTLDEAIMKMDLSGEVFLIYRSEEDKKLKVIYRRKNGFYGIVEVEPQTV